MGCVTVVTLGSGAKEYLSLGTIDAIKHTKKLILRTGRHPIAPYLNSEGIAFTTLDELYEQTESFDELNLLGAETLRELSDETPIVYATSDPMTDSILAELKKKEQIQLRILPGISHAERCLAMANAVATAVQICTAEAFALLDYMPSVSLLITELHSRECAGECKLKLLSLMNEDAVVSFISGKEETGELSKKEFPLYELDRQKHYDHLTAVYVPGLPWNERQRYSMDDLMKVVERLRSPGGCPWDLEQTHESLLKNLLEESYEYIQAVHEEDVEHMTEELGDVLLQVALHSVIAKQCGEFDINDVTSAVCGKMIERHSHVFGGEIAASAEDVLARWEARKCAQRGILSCTEAMRSVSTALSPLLRASKVQNKAHGIGFDFADSLEALTKVTEETDEVVQNLQNDEPLEEELGDLLFSVVNVCRLAKIDPDIAVSRATDKFIRRFSQLEKAVLEDGRKIEGLTLEEMNVYWEASKKQEKV